MIISTNFLWEFLSHCILSDCKWKFWLCSFHIYKGNKPKVYHCKVFLTKIFLWSLLRFFVIHISRLGWKSSSQLSGRRIPVIYLVSVESSAQNSFSHSWGKNQSWYLTPSMRHIDQKLQYLHSFSPNGNKKHCLKKNKNWFLKTV